MYRLLIVDDEDFEREGMAQLIDWSKYEVEISGTAWNGQDALEKIKECRPDMILTDIKMPVMDGIELIHRVHEAYPEIQFAVLSGYGEYEFTSKAMEEGVRHYVLKPCDEPKVLEVIEKVKKDVDRIRKDRKKEQTYQNSIVPKARKQLFQNLLLNRENGKAEMLFLREPGTEEGFTAPDQVRILTLRSDNSFDWLEEFVLENILDELLDKRQVRLYLTTVIGKDAVLLLSDVDTQILAPMVGKISRVLCANRKKSVRAAVSRPGSIEELPRLYQQTEELFVIGNRSEEGGLLHYGMFEGKSRDEELLVDFSAIGKGAAYDGVLKALQITFLRMERRNYTLSEKEDRMKWLLHILGWQGEAIPGLEYREEKAAPEERTEGRNMTLAEVEKSQALFITTVDEIYKLIAEKEMKDKEEMRYQEILREIYRNFRNQELGLHYLSTEVLFCNEDYLGRFFQKMSGQKFTAYVQEARISVACELMILEPDCKISELSEMLGYAADGQYFSKAFKKVKGITPSEYRECMEKEESNQ